MKINVLQTSDIHEHDLWQSEHFENSERFEVGERSSLDFCAFVQLGHLENFQSVEILKIALDDVGDRICRDVQIFQISQLGPSRGQTETEIRNVVVRNVEREERRFVENFFVQNRDGVVRQVEVSQKRSFQNRDGQDSGAGHVETPDGFRFVQHVLDRFLGQRVEAQVDLLDVDQDVCVGRNAGDGVVRNDLQKKIFMFGLAC